jgi:hypothetical protein
VKPSYRQAQFGEVEALLFAYAGMPADDTDDKPGPALEAWLRHTGRTHPTAIAVAARQIRDLLAMSGAHMEADQVRRRLPDLGLDPAARDAWLAVLAGHLERVVDNGIGPPSLPPQTHWEWRARFPELAQLLSGWFSQDVNDEFPDHDTAVADYLGTTAPDLIAALAGEISELLALALGDGETAVGLAELGLEAEPPDALTPAAWLAHLAGQLTEPAPE